IGAQMCDAALKQLKPAVAAGTGVARVGHADTGAQGGAQDRVILGTVELRPVRRLCNCWHEAAPVQRYRGWRRIYPMRTEISSAASITWGAILATSLLRILTRGPATPTAATIRPSAL